MEQAKVRRTEDYSRGKSGQVEAPDGTRIAVEWRGVVSRVTDERGGGGRPDSASARGVGDGIVRGPGILPGEGTRDLCASSSLEAAGILRQLANYLDANIPNADLIASIVGVASAIIDNVPLVAATMGMYDLTSFPQDSDFWQLVAFCAGTGDSMLIIGSAEEWLLWKWKRWISFGTFARNLPALDPVGRRSLRHLIFVGIQQTLQDHQQVYDFSSKDGLSQHELTLLDV